VGTLGAQACLLGGIFYARSEVVRRPEVVGLPDHAPHEVSAGLEVQQIAARRLVDDSMAALLPVSY